MSKTIHPSTTYHIRTTNNGTPTDHTVTVAGVLNIQYDEVDATVKADTTNGNTVLTAVCDGYELAGVTPERGDGNLDEWTDGADEDDEPGGLQSVTDFPGVTVSKRTGQPVFTNIPDSSGEPNPNASMGVERAVRTLRALAKHGASSSDTVTAATSLVTASSALSFSRQLGLAEMVGTSPARYRITAKGERLLEAAMNDDEFTLDD